MQKRNWFVSNFEHVNFIIIENYSQKIYENPNYYVSLWSFKHTKMQFKKMFIHFGGSFYCDFTLLGTKYSLEWFQNLPNVHIIHHPKKPLTIMKIK